MTDSTKFAKSEMTDEVKVIQNEPTDDGSNDISVEHDDGFDETSGEGESDSERADGRGRMNAEHVDERGRCRRHFARDGLSVEGQRQRWWKGGRKGVRRGEEQGGQGRLQASRAQTNGDVEDSVGVGECVRSCGVGNVDEVGEEDQLKIEVRWTDGKGNHLGEEDAKIYCKNNGDWQAQEGWREPSSSGKWGSGVEGEMFH